MQSKCNDYQYLFSGFIIIETPGLIAQYLPSLDNAITSQTKC